MWSHRRLRHSLLFLAFVYAATAHAADVAPPNFEEHIKPIFRQYCAKCHGDDKQNADLNLQSFGTVLRGGSGGKVVVTGRSSQSLLFQAITNADDEARMPPKSRPLPEQQITLIKQWIDGGLLASSGSESLTRAVDSSFTPSAAASQKPAGSPAMPTNLPAVDVPATIRPLSVLALDASPWAPVAAAAAMGHIRLIHTETEQELGKLPFPEGVPHVVRFSRNGSVLLAAGGKPVQSGRAVLFDVASGKRLTTIGDEIDAVLAADLSPDQQFVALGGTGKVVKVYSTTDGAPKYSITKHIDWITAVAFSPDNTRLATADRSGGIYVWDARNGGALLSLSEHKAAVHALAWRSDSRLLVSAGEDGLLIWWNASDGWPAISKTGVHQPPRPKDFYGQLRSGVLAAAFGPDGKLLSVGRDRVARLWSTDGTALKVFPLESGLPIAAAISADGKRLLCGDSLGKVHVWPSTP